MRFEGTSSQFQVYDKSLCPLDGVGQNRFLLSRINEQFDGAALVPDFTGFFKKSPLCILTPVFTKWNMNIHHQTQFIINIHAQCQCPDAQYANLNSPVIPVSTHQFKCITTSHLWWCLEHMEVQEIQLEPLHKVYREVCTYMPMRLMYLYSDERSVPVRMDFLQSNQW